MWRWWCHTGCYSAARPKGAFASKLIEENLLDAVVGLPGNLFPTTSIPVAILIFDRSREKGGADESRKDVLFIDASREYQPGKNQNTLLDEHLDKIILTYQKRKSIEKYAHLAGIAEIEENDFNLNIPRYVDTFEGRGSRLILTRSNRKLNSWRPSWRKCAARCEKCSRSLKNKSAENGSIQPPLKDRHRRTAKRGSGRRKSHDETGEK